MHINLQVKTFPCLLTKAKKNQRQLISQWKTNPQPLPPSHDCYKEIENIKISKVGQNSEYEVFISECQFNKAPAICYCPNITYPTLYMYKLQISLSTCGCFNLVRNINLSTHQMSHKPCEHFNESQSYRFHFIYFLQLHAVPRTTQQGKQREPGKLVIRNLDLIEMLPFHTFPNYVGVACRVAELNAALLYVVTRARK